MNSADRCTEERKIDFGRLGDQMNMEAKGQNVQNVEQLIRNFRHQLHQHPELSGCEKKTIQRIRQFLSNHTSLDIFDREGWLYAVKTGSDPDAGSIAFRADMDALPIHEEKTDIVEISNDIVNTSYASVNPGVSHKCGHDGHCAALCALALKLDAADIRKTVYLIFQPAEEIGGGGKHCAKLIREKQISEVYAFHNLSGWPEGEIVYRRGLTQPASEGLTILFHGKTSHASAPEDGINPSEAIARTALFAQSEAAKPHRGMVLCTVVGMTAGTGDFGISAGEGSLKLTLRAEYEEEMREMEEAVLSFAEEQAGQTGLHIAHEIADYFPETRNSDAGIRRVLQAAEELKIPAKEMPSLWRASEDFGYYLKECDGAMFYIGSGEDWPALHTKEYDFNDNLLETAAAVFFKLAEI